MYNAYLITNIVTGQQYIGISKKPYAQRFKDHWIEAKQERKSDTRKGSKLHQDMISFGLGNFVVELLQDNIPDDPEALHQDVERMYIEQYRSYYLDENDGYNMTRGGNGTAGYVFTEADRIKLSELHRGKPLNITPEGRESRRKRMLKENRPFKQEWKDAIRAKRLGKYTGEENGFFGKHHSPEVLEAIRLNNSKGAVLQLDDNGSVVKEFFNLEDAGRWASETVSSASHATCAARIGEVVRHGDFKCTAYGYHWTKKEGLSTNCSPEDELPDEAQSTV